MAMQIVMNITFFNSTTTSHLPNRLYFLAMLEILI